MKAGARRAAVKEDTGKSDSLAKNYESASRDKGVKYEKVRPKTIKHEIYEDREWNWRDKEKG